MSVSLPGYSYRDLAWTKHKFKKCFFGQNFQTFWQNWILIFRCTTSVGMLFLDFFANYLHKRFLEIWLGQEKRYRQSDGRMDARTARLTDGRTYTEEKTMYVSRRGRHIILYKTCFEGFPGALRFIIKSNLSLLVTCLPPAGNVYRILVPCMSVCPSATLPLSGPYLQES